MASTDTSTAFNLYTSTDESYWHCNHCHTPADASTVSRASPETLFSNIVYSLCSMLPDSFLVSSQVHIEIHWIFQCLYLDLNQSINRGHCRHVSALLKTNCPTLHSDVEEEDA